MKTTKDIIRQITLEHIKSGGIFASQSLSGTGENTLQGTFPPELIDHPNVLELPISDVSNGGIVTGIAMHKPTIYVVRFAPLLSYNLTTIVNYGAKAKEFGWKRPKLLIRCLEVAGQIGPVCSGAYHSALCRWPGVRVESPITPSEYLAVYDNWRNNRYNEDVVFICEPRTSYQEIDIPDLNDRITLDIESILTIGSTRRTVVSKYRKENIFHIKTLKPLDLSNFYTYIDATYPYGHRFETPRVTIIDSDYEICGISEHIAQQIRNRYPWIHMKIVAKEDRSHGFSLTTDNYITF